MRFYGLSAMSVRLASSEKLPVTFGFWSPSVYPQTLHPLRAALFGAGRWLLDKGPPQSSRRSDSGSPKKTSAVGHARDTGSGVQQQTPRPPPCTASLAQTTCMLPGPQCPHLAPSRTTTPVQCLLAWPGNNICKYTPSLSPAQPTSGTSSSHCPAPRETDRWQCAPDAPGPNPAVAAMLPSVTKTSTDKASAWTAAPPRAGGTRRGALPFGGQGGIGSPDVYSGSPTILPARPLRVAPLDSQLGS